MTSVPTCLQFQTTECGVAVLAMMMAYHGRPVPMEDIRRVTGVSRDCLSASDIVRCGRQFGFRCSGHRVSFDRLRSEPTPFILHMDFIHFVVVEDVQQDWITINDPASGRSEIHRTALDESFTGIIIRLQPEDTTDSEADRQPEPVSPRTELTSFLGLWYRMSRRTRMLVAAALSASVAETALLVLMLLTVSGTGATDLHEALVTSSVVITLLLTGQVMLAACRHFALRKTQENITRSETASLTRKLLGSSYHFINYRLPGDMFKALSDVDEVADSIATKILPALLTLPCLLILLATMITLQPAVGLAITGVIILASVILIYAHARFARFQRMLRGKKDQNLGNLSFNLEHIEGSKIAGRDEDFFASGLGSLASRLVYDQHDSAQKTVERVTLQTGSWVILAIAVSAMLMPRASETTSFQMLLLSGGMLLLAPRWRGFFSALDEARHRLIRIDDVHESSEIDRNIRKQHTDQAPDVLADLLALRLDAVTFGHSRTRLPLFDGISLDLPKGDQLGITGPSGGGKSSFGALAAGLHQPWSGTITCGRHEGGSGIAWVDKSVFLFDGSLRDNLTLWDNSISDTDIWSALATACLAEIIRARPDGLDCHVTARGRNFSGGQCQRMEIARAILHNPSIIILDEALDALDPALEEILRSNLRDIGCSLIVISHRTSTLIACDRIYSLRQGVLEPFDISPEQADGTRQFSAPGPRGEFVSPSYSQSSQEPFDSQLSDAFRILREKYSLPAIRNDNEELSDNRGEPVYDTARQNNLFVRPIDINRRDWWHQAITPFLGVRTSDRTAAAVLPDGNDYRIAGRSELESAKHLNPKGHALYPRDNLSDNRIFSLFWRRQTDTGRDCLRICSIGLALLLIVATIPFFASQAIDLGLSDHPNIIRLAVTLPVTAGILILLATALTISSARLQTRIELGVMRHLYQRLVRISPAFIRKVRPENLARSLGAVARLLDQMRDTALTGLTDIIMLAGGFLALLTIDWRLAITALALMLPILLISFLVTTRNSHRHRIRFDHRLRVRRFLSDMLRGIGRLICLKTENRAAAEWLQLHDRSIAAENRIVTNETIGKLAQQTAIWFAAFAFLFLLTTPEITAGIGLPERVLALAVFWLCLISLLSVTANIQQLGAAISFTSDLRDLLEAPLEPGGQSSPPKLSLCAEDIWYSYQGAGIAALKGISLTIEPGTITAIAGPSGSGKSTLVNLLLGFDRPDKGHIRYGDRSFDDLDLMSWRRRIGMVQQDDRIQIASTLRSHITGFSRYTRADAEYAAGLAELTETIAAMPMGMQTILERDKFSTGQEQRLLLASQLVRSPSILILDEATNAIQEDLQQRIFANIRALGITCILVTHRESAIREADNIILLEAGRISWSGPFKAFERRGDLRSVLAKDRRIEERQE